MTPVPPTDASRPARPSAPAIGFGTLLHGMRRYSLLTFLVVLLTAGAAAGIWFFLPLPKLTGYSVVQIAAAPQYVLNPMASDQRVELNLYRNTQSNLVKSRKVLSPALDKPGVMNTQMVRECDSPDRIYWLSNALKVDLSQGPELMRLVLEGNNQDELLLLTSAIHDAYLEVVQDSDKSRRRDRFLRLQKFQTDYDEQLRKERNHVTELIRVIGTGSPETSALMDKNLEEQIGMTQRELYTIDQKKREVDVELSLYERGVGTNAKREVPTDLLDELIKADPAYKILADKQTKLKDDVERDRKQVERLGNGVRHPTLEANEKKLADATADLDKLAQRLQSEYATRYQLRTTAADQQQLTALRKQTLLLTQQREMVKKLCDQLIQKKEANSDVRVQLDLIKQRIATTEKTADRITAEVEAIRPELDSPSRVTVFESPTVVPGIEGNRRLKYTVLAGVGVLFLGLALVTGLEHRNRRILSVSEVTGGLGLKVVGTVPRVPRGVPRSSDEEIHWQQAMAEAVDSARVLLLPAPVGKNAARTILISSALSGEGKTSVATRLAVSLARAGFRTLLIDADMRRPAVHKVFEMRVEPGLSDVLAGRLPVTAAIQDCGLPGLDILPAGKWRPECASGLSGEQWAAIRAAAETDHDVVLVDSPPILPVADALLLANRVDGVVLSVMRDVSRYEAVEQARNKLSLVGANVLGVVMSGVTGHRHYYYYDRRYAVPLPAAPQSPDQPSDLASTPTDAQS